MNYILNFKLLNLITILFSVVLSPLTHSSMQFNPTQFNKNDAVFVLPSITGDEFTNKIPPKIVTDIKTLAEAGVNKDGNNYTISIPYKDKDGNIVLVEVEYTEEDGTRTLNIPGKGELTVITPPNGGDPTFILTPEQVKKSNNISCSFNASGTKKCSISPVLVVVGDGIFSTGKADLEFSKDGSYKILGLKSNAWNYTTKDGNTGFTNGDTSASDLSVVFKIGRQGDDTPEEKSKPNKFKNPFKSPIDEFEKPESFKNANFIEASISANNVKHTIYNPKDPTQSATQFEVKDGGGIVSKISFKNSDERNLNISAATTAGVSYNSNPFSDETLKVETTAPVMLNFNINESDGARASLSLLVAAKDKDGELSKTTISDITDKDNHSTITSTGPLGLNLTQETTTNTEGKFPKFVPDSLVGFELVSNELEINRTRNNKGKVEKQDILLKGLMAEGTYNKETNSLEAAAIADSFTQKKTKNGKLDNEIAAGRGIEYIITDNDHVRKQEALAGFAYYNNGEVEGTISDGAFVQLTQYKDKSTAEVIDGKTVSRKAYGFGETGVVTKDDLEANITGGFGFEEIKFNDSSKKMTFTGQAAKLNNDEYTGGMNEGLIIQTTVNKKNDLQNLLVQGGKLGLSDNKTHDSVDIFKTNTYVEVTGKTDNNKDIMSLSHSSEKVLYGAGDGTSKAVIDALAISAVDADTIKYGTITVDEATYNKGLLANGNFDENIKIEDINIAFYIDESDPKSKYTNAIVDLGHASATGADYSIDIFAKNEAGIDEKFTIYYLEEGVNKYGKIYNTNGELVHVMGKSKGKDLPVIVFNSLDYFESDKFKQAIGTNVSGTLLTIEGEDNKLQGFNVASGEAFELLDGSFKQYTAKDISASESDYNKGTEITSHVDEVVFTEKNTIDLEELNVHASNATINFHEIDKLDAKATIGSMIASQITKKNGDTIKLFRANDLSLVAVDVEEMIDASGSVKEISFYEDKNIQSIELSELNNLTVNDLESGATARIDGDKILRVIERNDEGEEIGSYLLVKNSFLKATDLKKGINADIRVGVLEFMQDKLTGKDILLDVDIEGIVTLDKGGLHKAEANFALKGKNITYDSSSYVSDDGSQIKKNFILDTQGAEGRIDKVELNAGPSFWKNFISLNAKGGKDGGRSISFSLEQNKKKGQVYLRAEFKDGDEITAKLLPFKWKTEKGKDGAELDQTITFKGQSAVDNLEIISQIISGQEITDYLRVSPGGAITARTGTIGGVGLELMYMDEENLKFTDIIGFNGPGNSQRKAKSFGLSVVNVSDNGDVAAAGVALTGDSEIDVHTKKGEFSIFGIKQSRESRLPGTATLFWKKKYNDGDGFYTSVFYTIPTAMVDETTLDKNAAFYENGRTIGGAGANIAYFKQLDKGSSFTVAAIMNNDFKDPTVCATYTNNNIDPLSDLAGGVMNIVNGLPFSAGLKRPDPIKRKSGLDKQEIDRLNAEIAELQLRYDGAAAFEKINRALTAVKAANEGKGPKSDAERKVLAISIEDLAQLELLESDLETKRIVGSVAEKLKESKVLSNPKMTAEDKTRWKMINLKERMNKLSDNYSHVHSIDIYIEYLEKFRRLERLGAHGTILKR